MAALGGGRGGRHGVGRHGVNENELSLLPIQTPLSSLATQIAMSKKRVVVEERGARMRVVGGKENAPKKSKDLSTPMSKPPLRLKPPVPVCEEPAAWGTGQPESATTCTSEVIPPSSKRKGAETQIPSSQALANQRSVESQERYRYVPPAITRYYLWDSTPLSAPVHLIPIIPPLISVTYPALAALKHALKERYAKQGNNGKVGFLIGRSTREGVIYDRYDGGRGENPTFIVPGDVIATVTGEDSKLIKDERSMHDSRSLSFHHLPATIMAALPAEGEYPMRLRYASMSTNVSAKATSIHPLRVVPNTVLTDLTRASATSPARYGYITIDQGRQALLLQDTDPILDRIAVAGVWVQNVSYDDWRTVHACIKTWLGAKVKRMDCPRMVLWCVGQGWWEMDIRQEPEDCATYVAETVVAHGTAAQMTVKKMAMASRPLGMDSERTTLDCAAQEMANSGEEVCPEQGLDASTDSEIIMPAGQPSEPITPTDATVKEVDATPAYSPEVIAAEEAPPDAQDVILHRLDQLQQQLDVLLLTKVAPSSRHDASTNTSWAFAPSDQCPPPLNANAYDVDAKELIARVVRHSEQSFIIR